MPFVGSEKKQTFKPNDSNEIHTTIDGNCRFVGGSDSADSRRGDTKICEAAKAGMETQLKEIEARWTQAFVSRDAAVVESILADNYVLTDEKGKVFNRSSAIKEFKSETDTLEKSTNSNVVVHPISSNAAVVTGMTNDIGKDNSGKKFDRVFRWTDTFVNRNGKWECVASQVALVSQK